MYDHGSRSQRHPRSLPQPPRIHILRGTPEVAGRIQDKAEPRLIGGAKCFQVVTCQSSRHHQSGSSAPGGSMQMLLEAPRFSGPERRVLLPRSAARPLAPMPYRLTRTVTSAGSLYVTFARNGFDQSACQTPGFLPTPRNPLEGSVTQVASLTEAPVGAACLHSS